MEIDAINKQNIMIDNYMFDKNENDNKSNKSTNLTHV